MTRKNERSNLLAENFESLNVMCVSVEVSLATLKSEHISKVSEPRGQIKSKKGTNV